MSANAPSALSSANSPLLPPSLEGQRHGDYGIAQRVNNTSGTPSATTSPSAQDMFHATAVAAAPLEIDTRVHETAAMAAPNSHPSSLAASTGRSTPPPSSPPLHLVDAPNGGAAAADGVKNRNENVRRNVYVSGIPPAFRSEEFRQLCMQFGRVEAAKLCVDNRNAPTKAYGFALYFSEESAAACIRGLNGSFLQGRCVQARLADSHATPQPLGEEGSAANTTIPPPPHQHNRVEQRDGGRGSTGTHRKGRSATSTRNASAGGSRRGVSPVSPGVLSSPGLQSGMPTPPYTALPGSPMMISPPEPTAIPLDVNAYLQLMSLMQSSSPPQQQQQQAQMALMAAAAPPPQRNTTRTFSPPIAAAAVGNDGGFGAVGTPVTGALSSPPFGTSALSPASMALSPPLLSPHSTDSCGSTSPNASRATAVHAHRQHQQQQQQQQRGGGFHSGAAALVAPGQHPQMLPYTTAGAAASPYPVSYLPPQQHQPQMLPAAPAGQMAFVTGTAVDGTPTVMYYPIPSGMQQAGMPGIQLTAAAPAMAAKPTAGPLPGSVMYFTMPQQPQQQQAAYMQMAPPPPPPQMQATTPPAMPANYVVLDNHNLGMQLQFLRQS